MSSAPALEARLTIAVGREDTRFEVEVELALASGVLVLFGPSGAGKSLTLAALAGLVTPAKGRLTVGGDVLWSEDGVDVPAHRRRMGYVPQQQALFPNLTVAENVAFGLPRAERSGASARVVTLLEEIEIAHLARRRIDLLSGGERQRVSLARALATSPRMLLLDEPFASIDRGGRSALRETLRAALQRRGTSAIFVTHDPDEALAIGDRLTLFERGRTLRTATPVEILGAPRISIRGTLVSPAVATRGGRTAVRLHDAEIEGPSDALAGTDGAVDLTLALARKSE